MARRGKQRAKARRAAKKIEKRKQVRRGNPNALNAIDTAFQASGEVLDAIEQRFEVFRKTWVGPKDENDLAILQAALLAAHSAEFTAGVLFEAPEVLRPNIQRKLLQLVPQMREEIWGKRRFLELRVKELEVGAGQAAEAIDSKTKVVEVKEPEEEELSIGVCPHCHKQQPDSGHRFTRSDFRKCMLGLHPTQTSGTVPATPAS